MRDKPSAERRPPRFDLIGGHVCADFVNTLDDRFSDHPKELLASYVDLARFAEDTGILEPAQAHWLATRSLEFPEMAQPALRAVIELREALYQIFSAIMAKRSAPPLALAQLNGNAQEAARRMELVETRDGFAWRFRDTTSFNAILWPLARSAAELLASGQVSQMRACASDTCRWLFVDTSKNHRRRWCDMTRCGNRAKARRFYARQKENAGG
jgi:predicted RNA-binding Zn ribbon-like protein